MTDFIFKKKNNNNLGDLEFLGDFDGLYSFDPDPWGQSGLNNKKSMSTFYTISREILCNRISEIHKSTYYTDRKYMICEIGSGTGFLTNMLKQSVPSAHTCGVDISKIAVKKARINFPDIKFYQHDILSEGLKEKFNIVILSNLLWYVIHDLDNLIVNVVDSVKKNNKESFLVLQNALFKNHQNYGSNLISSIGTMTDVFTKRLSSKVQIQSVTSELHCSPLMEHDFGLIIFKF
jgi:SAM-dependent methyltransferase